MAGEDDPTMELDGLDGLLKALKRPPPVIRVGILGGAARPDGQTNAQIGAHHEYGAPKAHIPRRSFLREPLADKLGERMEASGALDADAMKEVVKSGSVMAWARKVAVLAEAIVLEAFSTAGFGKWAPLKPATMRRKKVKQILVETQQLRNSITSEVRE